MLSSPREAGLDEERAELDVAPLDDEHAEPGAIEPADPLAKVEPAGLQGGTGVPGQEHCDRPVDLVPGGVDVDQG